MLVTLRCVLARQELSLLLRDPLCTQGTLVAYHIKFGKIISHRSP